MHRNSRAGSSLQQRLQSVLVRLPGRLCPHPLQHEGAPTAMPILCLGLAVLAQLVGGGGGACQEPKADTSCHDA